MITIIIATYNRAHFIFETLVSIKNQTYKDFECLIIDDGGNDNTLEIITPILKDKRFKFIKRSNDYQKGLSGSRNFGLSLAKGNYIVFCDDDDIIHPKWLEVLQNKLKNNPQIDFIHYKKQSFENKFDYKKFESKLFFNFISLKDELFEDVIIGKLPLASCTVIWKKKIFEKSKFKENLHYAEEWELYSRILIEQNLNGLFLDDILYFNRKHPESNTGEFWKNNSKRVNSKKEAIKNIVSTVLKNNKLTKLLFEFFVKQAYVYKLPELTSNIFKSKRTTGMLFYKITFPVRFNLYKISQSLKK